jgi:hypothetical protein
VVSLKSPRCKGPKLELNMMRNSKWKTETKIPSGKGTNMKSWAISHGKKHTLEKLFISNNKHTHTHTHLYLKREIEKHTNNFALKFQVAMTKGETHNLGNSRWHKHKKLGNSKMAKIQNQKA